MPCTCPQSNCIQYTEAGVDYCSCSGTINNVVCPEGCTLITLQSGNAYCSCIDSVPVISTDVLTPISLPDPEYFEDVSWTTAFSLNTGSWLSFYGFYPNYYINHNSYFQTGRNNAVDNNELGLWSHLLTNKSFQVFYGKKQIFTVEYPIKSDYTVKKLKGVKLFTEAKRYANDYDFSVTPNLTFNKSIIYNNVGCSGQLLLDIQQPNLANVKDYPKTNQNNTQNILITNKDNFQFTYDYIFNRIKYNTTNIPTFIQDKNQINKQPNPEVVKFYGINPLKKMEGDWFLNRVSYDVDSRFSLTLKFVLNESQNT
jgi:hypothetical protein